MKSACLLAVLAVAAHLAVPSDAIFTSLFDKLSQRADAIADRIDAGIQHTVNPMVDQLSQNVRETLGNWNRPFSQIASGHPNPVAPPHNSPPTKSEGFSNPFDLSPLLQGLFDSNHQRDWWKGPNVCIERDEIDETKSNSTSKPDERDVVIVPEEKRGSLRRELDGEDDDDDDDDGGFFARRARQFSAHVRMSSCNDDTLSYICETKVRSNGVRKTYKTRYSCCYGTLREPGEFGCHPVEMRSLQETVFALGGRSFLSLMKEAEIGEKILSVNHTYFVPVDRSSPAATEEANDVNTTEEKVVDEKEATPAKEAKDEVSRAKRATIARMDADPALEKKQVRTLVRSHMVRGIRLTTELHDEQLLDTEDPDAKIRINLYSAPSRVYTANCVRLVSSNNYAQQGVIHMLDGVMKPATKTIAQLLEDEPHFSSFRKLLRPGDVERLGKGGQLTVFAPTDDAFGKLDADVRDRLMKGQGCVHSLVEHHVLPNVICSTVIQGRARSATLLGTSLVLERDLEGKLYVNGKQVITRDVMASNGVIHVIDGVLIPETARSFTQLLSAANLTELSRLVEAAGLAAELDSLTNATLFAPNDYAVRLIPDAVKQSWISNPDKLRDILTYHLVKPGVRQNALANNRVLDTGLKNNNVRMNFYQSIPFFNALPPRATVQCASVLRWDQEACNGNVHIVDRVLVPPESTITEWLAANRSFSIMTKLLKDARLDELLSGDGPFTVLAAPDVAFYQMPEEALAEIRKDARKAAAVLKQHILPEHVCCAGFRGDWFIGNKRRTHDGNFISLQRHLDGSLTAGDAHVMDCDRLAKNGVIHVVEHVIMPKQGNVLPFLSGTRRLGLPGMELIFNHGK